MNKWTFILLCVFTFCTFGQKKDQSPNSLYENFSQAYETLDAKIIGSSYFDDAILLNLYDSENPNSVKGASHIEQYFTDFFQRCKDANQQLKLSFKIISREKVEEHFYDNGYYKLEIKATNQPDYTSYGKLSTVIGLDNGVLKFKVDANTNTDEAEFVNAKTDSIPQPK